MWVVVKYNLVHRLGDIKVILGLKCRQKNILANNGWCI